MWRRLDICQWMYTGFSILKNNKNFCIWFRLVICLIHRSQFCFITRCTQDILGTIGDPTQPKGGCLRDFTTGLPTSTCIFTPSQSTTSAASIMYAEWLSSVSDITKHLFDKCNCWYVICIDVKCGNCFTLNIFSDTAFFLYYYAIFFG